MIIITPHYGRTCVYLRPQIRIDFTYNRLKVNTSNEYAATYLFCEKGPCVLNFTQYPARTLNSACQSALDTP